VSVVNAAFGNAWHGQLGPSALQLADGTQMVAAPSGSSEPPVPYAAPGFGENLGSTYYYKTPGIGPATTPPAVAAIGGEFKNDAVFFGSNQRYSPFGLGGVGQANAWLHYGADGKWRRLFFVPVSIGWQSMVVDVVCDDRPFSEINRPAPAAHRVIARLSLPDVPYDIIYDRELSYNITVRHDGRQIALCLWGKWANSASHPEVYNNSTVRSIAIAWRIDIAEDLSSASAVQVWAVDDKGMVIADPVVTEQLVPTGPVAYVEIEGWRYYFQPVYMLYINGAEWSTTIERLVGVGFSADGTLHLSKFTFSEGPLSVWSELWGHVELGVYLASSGYVPVGLPPVSDPLPESYVYAYENTGLNIVPPPVIVRHNYPQTILVRREVSSNGVVLKSISDPNFPKVNVQEATNNVADLRIPGQSICRVGPGCIDDSIMTGSVFGAFNPRTGTVHSSGSAIGFV